MPPAMTPLAYTIAAALAGGVLAVVAAAFTLALRASWVQRLVSFAVGALLGAVFLELLPHALEEGSPSRVMGTVLAGLLAFFLLEKLVLWRHAHGHGEHHDDEDETEHDHALHAQVAGDGGRSGLMILIGTSVHNFCDGVVIAASFLADPALGIAATVAIVAHAVPQQVECLHRDVEHALRVVATDLRDRRRRLHGLRAQARRKTSVPLVPPKPKLFFTATSIFRSRAVLAQ